MASAAPSSPVVSNHFSARSRRKETLPDSGMVNAIAASSSSSAPTEAELPAVKTREGVYVIPSARAETPEKATAPPSAAAEKADASKNVNTLDLYFFI